jgi:hypothetical protein
MTMNEDFTRGFFNTLVILKSYSSEIVVGGGWAPFLYYRYLVGNRNHAPVRTSDIDLIVKHHVPKFGSKTIDELLTEANLEAKFKTLDTPPIIHYEGKIEGADVEIEFLTDQTGLRPNTVLEVQKGLHAEALRYVSILVENTLELVIDDVGTIQDGPPIIVQVPTPAAYIFQLIVAVCNPSFFHSSTAFCTWLFDMFFHRFTPYPNSRTVFTNLRASLI